MAETLHCTMIKFGNLMVFLMEETAAAALIIALVFKKKRERAAKRKKRTKWVKQWLLQRPIFGVYDGGTTAGRGG